MTTVTTYGPGGFDPSKKNNNIVEEVEVDAPDLPPSPEDRLADLEARIEAVAALADKANATAQEVAQAARDGQPPKR
jgi:hypothetical protein